MSYELRGVKTHVLDQAQYYMDKGFAGYKVTSPFGERTHPVTGKAQTAHEGLDVIGAYGWGAMDWIVAPEDGVLVYKRDGVTLTAQSGEDKEERVAKIYQQGVTSGNYVVLRHDTGIETLYKHLQNKSITSKNVGDMVEKGERLGYMGTTGLSTGVHLHFEVQVDKIAVDPEPYLLGTKSLSLIRGEDVGYIFLEKELKYGDKGEAVKKLQLRLCQLSKELEEEVKGHSFTKQGEPDGGYGKGLVGTMKKLQEELGFEQTGELDAPTREVINKGIWEWQQELVEQYAALLAQDARLEQQRVTINRLEEELRKPSELAEALKVIGGFLHG